MQGADGQLRPVQPEDIVLLMRSPKSRMADFGAALSRCGIPYSGGERESFFQTLEISTVYSLLQIIDNPRQDVPLIAVLRSPLYGFTPDLLAAIRGCARGDFFAACCACEEEPVQAFVRQLRELRDLAAELPADQLLWQVYDRLHILGVFGAMEDGELRRSRLLNLCRYAEDLAAAGRITVFELADYLRGLMARGKEPQISSEQSAGGVEIMSIHRSKGLEFPVVILCDLNREFNREDMKSPVLVHSRLGLGTERVDPQLRVRYPTVSKTALAREMEREMLSEEMRLLYVAMTRAKEQLCMTGMVSSLEEMGLDYNSRSEMNHYCDMVLPAVYRRGDLFDLEVLEWQDLVLEEASQQKEVDREKDRLYNFDTSKVYNVSMHEILELRKTVREEKEVLPVKVSVSELKEKSMEELDMEEFHILSAQEEPDEEPVPSFMGGGKEKRENAGAAYGTVWHQVMAFLDFSHVASRREIRESLEQVVQAGHVRREDLAVIQVSRLEQFFQSELGKQMCLAYEDGRLHREQPFVTSRPAKEVLADSGSEEAVLIQGIIDGYYFTEDGIVLMDYKTDRIQPGKEQDLADRYRTQMAVYRQALQDNTGRPVIKTVLYSFSLGKEVELEF